MSVVTKQNVTPEALAEEQAKLATIDQIIKQFKDEPGSLIKILHAVQNCYGYLPLHIQRHIAQKTGIPASEIAGVVSFYAFFATTPKADNEIKVCLGTACYVRGGKKIMDRLTKELAIAPGQTTENGKFSIAVTRCLGACGLAPVITINEDVYQQVNPDKLSKILSNY